MTSESVLTESPVFYKDEVVGLTSKIDVNRELTRYVFCIGDHIEAIDKNALISIGGRIGGLWVGHSETEGAPTMKRTNYMMYRAGIIPLETTAIPRKADHRELERQNENFLVGKDVPPGTRGYTVYAGDTLNYLQNDRFRPMGVVEITSLMGKPWNSGAAKMIQSLFFPDWVSWISNSKTKIPTLLDDLESIIRQTSEKVEDEQYAITGAEMLESARLFRKYAMDHIERNRQQISSQRNVNTGGFFTTWNERSRLYAKQLNIPLENEDDIRPTSVAPAIDPRTTKLALEEIELRKQELAQQRDMYRMLMSLAAEKLGVNTPISDNQEPQVAPPLVTVTDSIENETDFLNEADDISLSPAVDLEYENEQEVQAETPDISTGEDQRKCTEINNNGTPCSIEPKEGHTMCPIHERKAAKKQEEE